jgi:hypothetical protein
MLSAFASAVIALYVTLGYVYARYYKQATIHVFITIVSYAFYRRAARRLRELES